MHFAVVPPNPRRPGRKTKGGTYKGRYIAACTPQVTANNNEPSNSNFFSQIECAIYQSIYYWNYDVA